MADLVWIRHDTSSLITHTEFGPYMVERETENYFRIWLPDESESARICRGGYPTRRVAISVVNRLYALRLETGEVRPSEGDFQISYEDRLWPHQQQASRTVRNNEVVLPLTFDYSAIEQRVMQHWDTLVGTLISEACNSPVTLAEAGRLLGSEPQTTLTRTTVDGNSEEVQIGAGRTTNFQLEFPSVPAVPPAVPRAFVTVGDHHIEMAAPAIPQAATGQRLFTEMEAEAAQCLMESVLDIRAEVFAAEQRQEPLLDLDWKKQLDTCADNLGSFEMRRLCRDWALVIETIWREMPDEWTDKVVYDWEYMPAILELIDWSDNDKDPTLPDPEDIKAALAEFKGTLR